MENFNPQAYVGKWYEIVRDRLNPYTISTDCVTKEFGLNADGDVDLYFRGYYSILFRYNGIDGTLYQCDEGTPSTWTCMATMGGRPKRHPIKMFDTDYENYEIYYDCTEFAGFKTESFAVSSRT